MSNYLSWKYANQVFLSSLKDRRNAMEMEMRHTVRMQNNKRGIPLQKEVYAQIFDAYFKTLDADIMIIRENLKRAQTIHDKRQIKHANQG